MAERPGSRTYELPPSAPFTNHGKTKAAWTLLWLVVGGGVLLALGMVLEQLWLSIAGIVVVVVGIVAGLVMARRGLGQPADDSSERRADWYS